MPMKLECISLVCRMVKVFFPSTAANSPPGRRIVTPTAAETAKNSRREIVTRDMRVPLTFSSASPAGLLSLVFIVVSFLFQNPDHKPAGDADEKVSGTL